MARHYVFRLLPVLRLRERREDECRRRVAGQLRQIARVQGELQLLDDELTGEVSRIRDGQLERALDASLACRQRGYVAWLQRRRLDAGKAIAGLEAGLRTERAALVEAAREVKTLQKLRERQETRAAEAQRRQDRIEQDERAVQVYLRQTMARMD